MSAGGRDEERRKLADIIHHWNANRLDLFEISQPTEVSAAAAGGREGEGRRPGSARGGAGRGVRGPGAGRPSPRRALPRSPGRGPALPRGPGSLLPAPRPMRPSRAASARRAPSPFVQGPCPPVLCAPPGGWGLGVRGRRAALGPAQLVGHLCFGGAHLAALLNPKTPPVPRQPPLCFLASPGYPPYLGTPPHLATHLCPQTSPGRPPVSPDFTWPPTCVPRPHVAAHLCPRPRPPSAPCGSARCGSRGAARRRSSPGRRGRTFGPDRSLFL